MDFKIANYGSLTIKDFISQFYGIVHKKGIEDGRSLKANEIKTALNIEL